MCAWKNKSAVKVIHHKVRLSYFSQHNTRIIFWEVYCLVKLSTAASMLRFYKEHSLQFQQRHINTHILFSTYKMYVSMHRQVKCISERYLALWDKSCIHLCHMYVCWNQHCLRDWNLFSSSTLWLVWYGVCWTQQSCMGSTLNDRIGLLRGFCVRGWRKDRRRGSWSRHCYTLTSITNHSHFCCSFLYQSIKAFQVRAADSRAGDESLVCWSLMTADRSSRNQCLM